MLSVDPDSAIRKFPSLVHLCQRVAASNVDYISSLGDELTYPLVKPILDRCDAEQLLRLEQSSPHLQPDTPETWKNLCHSTFPLAIERYLSNIEGEPTSWKDQYFNLHESEARRLEEATTRLRNQRLEAEERKREREVKITDRVPPPKRPRTGWSTTPQPKSLFQKTRSEASKIQKNMYHSRIIPPMPNGKTFRVLSKPPDATLAFSSAPGNNTTRVTVNTVVHRRPATVSASSAAATSLAPGTVSPLRPDVRQGSITALPSQAATLNPIAPKKPPIPPEAASASTEPRPLKSQNPMKRDPMASLFVPKRRAHSQRPRCPG